MPIDCKTMIWILILFASSTGVSSSAEFRLDNHSIILEGEIRSGDFDRFDSLVKASGPKYDSLILGSLGGDLAEAMRIGGLVRELRHTVYAPVAFPSDGELFFEPTDSRTKSLGNF